MNSKEFIQSCIVKLEDDLQHYTMVDKDNVKAKYIELELIDYKKVLKDLDCFEVLEKEYERLDKDNHSCYLDYCELQAENEKVKKAIEIMRNKKVNIFLLLLHKLEDYNLLVCKAYQLTQQEYDLLKEVLE